MATFNNNTFNGSVQINEGNGTQVVNSGISIDEVLQLLETLQGKLTQLPSSAQDQELQGHCRRSSISPL